MGEIRQPDHHGNNEVREALRMRLRPSLRWEEGEVLSPPWDTWRMCRQAPWGQNPREQVGVEEQEQKP